MQLSEVLQPIRAELESDEQVREAVLPLVRQAVRACGRSIKNAHRRDFESALALLEEAYQATSRAQAEMERSDFLSRSRLLNTAYQELTEAANLISLLLEGVLVPPSKYNVPSRAYLTGLADVVGELRRAALDAVRREATEEAERLLSYMEQILDELVTFDYPNSLLPDLRRKCDVARLLVERTRGDVTNAVLSMRLMSRLRATKGPVDSGLRRTDGP